MQRIITFLLGFCLGVFTIYELDRFPLNRVHDGFGRINLPIGKRITLISTSPNTRARVFIIEQRFMFRSIELRLQKKGENTISIFIAETKDPPGAERVIWSKDSSKFILLGRNFYGIESYPEQFRSQNGELLYVLYNLNANQKYCHQPDIPDNNCLPLPSSILDEFREDSGTSSLNGSF
ncbi:MAG: hypothetical protein F6J87_00630 [Spirulina sp. SIO3F2]|nr:hypothetical protein [Spirulina sp. SIO3F2]